MPPAAWFGFLGERPCFRPCEGSSLDSLNLLLFIASIFSRVSTTSFIDGRLLGSPDRHFRVSCAAWRAPFEWYCPSSRGSISRASFRRSAKYGLAQSARLCCPLGRVGSRARWPDSISRSTTPNPYTSLFTYRWPNRLKSLVLG